MLALILRNERRLLYWRAAQEATYYSCKKCYLLARVSINGQIVDRACDQVELVQANP